MLARPGSTPTRGEFSPSSRALDEESPRAAVLGRPAEARRGALLMVGESLERFAPEAARGELVHSTDDHDDLLDATRRDVSTSGRAGVTECCRLRPIPSALRNGRAHNRFQSVFLIAAASDPNWFYSTVAQSTAAIVGLAGGFLAARLVSHRADIASERAPIRTSFLRLAQQIASWNQIASQFSASLMAVIGQAEEQQKRGALGQESVSLTNVSS